MTDRRIVHLICIECRVDFLACKDTQRFCSHGCANRFNARKRKKAKENASP